MDKPKCTLCGKPHWSNEPHVFVNNAVNKPKPVNNRVNKSQLVNNSVNQCCADKDKLIEDLKTRITELEQPTDRKTYMREYMRKRRMAN